MFMTGDIKYQQIHTVCNLEPYLMILCVCLQAVKKYLSISITGQGWLVDISFIFKLCAFFAGIQINFLTE